MNARCAGFAPAGRLDTDSAAAALPHRHQIGSSVTRRRPADRSAQSGGSIQYREGHLARAHLAALAQKKTEKDERGADES